MKATGIVRRVDDLGRIAIPKEIRRSMGIRDGEPLEIYLENNAVIFRKYETNLCGEVDNLDNRISDYIESWETKIKIQRLLEEVKELIKGEE